MHFPDTFRLALTVAAVALLGACDRGETLAPELDPEFSIAHPTKLTRGAV